MIILQAITPQGSISADWVLVIVVSICGFLSLMILNDMRNSIKAIILRQDEQAKEITMTTARTDFAHERIDEIIHDIKR